jgi:hypothetical protein
MPVKVMKCHCESKFQDKEHGKGNRVYNEAAKDGDWRCTVCNKAQSGGLTAIKKNPAKQEENK